jgi:hypothetical protein
VARISSVIFFFWNCRCSSRLATLGDTGETLGGKFVVLSAVICLLSAIFYLLSVVCYLLSAQLLAP